MESIKIYEVQMKDKNGEWKVWNRYETECLGASTKERAELGFQTAKCYGECRIVEK